MLTPEQFEMLQQKWKHVDGELNRRKQERDRVAAQNQQALDKLDADIARLTSQNDMFRSGVIRVEMENYAKAHGKELDPRKSQQGA